MFDYIETFSGRKFHFADPKPDEVCVEDIATALSNLCRYSGQINQFYSVAEHSIILSTIVYNMTLCPKEALSALLHDASEAYLVDVPRPIKPYLDGYFELEEQIQETINYALNVKPMNGLVQYLDTNIVYNEASILFNNVPDWVSAYTEVPHFKHLGLTPEKAKDMFLATYYNYKKYIGE